MKFYGHAEEVADKVLNSFKNGTLPAALAQVFIKRDDESPCRKWSFCNQLIVALMGYSDARGFRQWESVKRSIKKGEKAFHILAPVTITKHDDKLDKDYRVLIGFKSIAVFGYGQTKGPELPGKKEEQIFVDALPFIEVAKNWGLTVGTYNGSDKNYLGYYEHGKGIALGVENLATWAHELIHAADHKVNGDIVFNKANTSESEIIAELGGAVLLCMIGRDKEADLGGAWHYIDKYAERIKKPPIQACERVVNRVCKAINLIVETASKEKEAILT